MVTEVCEPSSSPRERSGSIGVSECTNSPSSGRAVVPLCQT
jgi:hypothetical protein